MDVKKATAAMGASEFIGSNRWNFGTERQVAGDGEAVACRPVLGNLVYVWFRHCIRVSCSIVSRRSAEIPLATTQSLVASENILATSRASSPRDSIRFRRREAFASLRMSEWDSRKMRCAIQLRSSTKAAIRSSRAAGKSECFLSSTISCPRVLLPSFVAKRSKDSRS